MENNRSNTWEEFLTNYAHIILLVGLIVTIFSPYLFTRNWNLVDFSQTGQIGDTIGGITGPIVGLLGAFLIYISFRAQIRANEIQRDALEEEKKRNNFRDNFSTLFALTQVPHKVVQSLHKRVVVATFDLCMYNAAQ